MSVNQKVFPQRAIANVTVRIKWFLATFGDLGWGKAAMLRAEGRRKKGISSKFKL
jgi:hypothetical protein